MFDTHAHVHSTAFDADRDAILARAKAAGVTRILTVGCDLADSKHALQTALECGLDWSLGIHPHEAKTAPTDLAAAFDDLCAGAGKAPCAIGECGLDYYYSHSPHDVQREVLVAQMRYAKAKTLPLIFHQRDAVDDFVTVLEAEWSGEMRGVVHCFTGDPEQAKRFTEFGLLLGIGGVATFKNADLLRTAVRTVGLERIILETDCPYLAPVPHRGQRNEPAFIADTAALVANVFDRPVAEIVAQTTATAVALFAA